MRILAIRGKNLASLYGDFEIDFTVEPLYSAGIFAITGSTGSGKSTILDALCLALFDNTPRMSLASDGNVVVPDVRDKTVHQKDCRNLLTRGSAEGYASVDFMSAANEKYRSTWTVKRARGRADGALQSSEMRLVNLSSGHEEQGRKTALLARIAELTGLTFEQFTRTVLLPQGDFAAFLKARQSEKAELLEKLTGTEIYSRISVLIYEKTKAAEQEYFLLRERIKDIELLDDEQIRAFDAEKGQLETDLARLKTETSNLSAGIKWLEDRETLRRGCREARESLDDIQNLIAGAGPRYDYLTRTESVQDIRDVFHELQLSERQHKDSLTLIKQKTAEWDVNAVALAGADTAHLSLLKEQEKLDNEIAEAEPEMIRARELDAVIGEAKAREAEAVSDRRAARSVKEKIEADIQALEKEILLAHRDALEMLPAEVALMRAGLEEGLPCPVCGSLHHPAHKDTSVRWTDYSEEAIRLREIVNSKTILLKSRQSSLADAIVSLAARESKCMETASRRGDLQKLRAGLLGGRPVDELTARYSAGRKEMGRNVRLSAERKSLLLSGQETLRGIISQIDRETGRLSRQCADLQQSLDKWISGRQDGLDRGQLALLLAKDHQWLQAERKFLNGLKEQETACRATLEERERNLEVHVSREVNNHAGVPETEDIDILHEEQVRMSRETDMAFRRVAVINAALAAHEKGKERIKAFEKDLDQKALSLENWGKLNELLGSATGSKFKEMAQGYTLDVLLAHANRHLRELSSRYLLQRIPDSLALLVSDLDMLGQIRTVHSLSGGESFLVSLALALGLASLVSNRMNIESIFIDEGFGALDADTLRLALDALEKLHMQGHKVGVISHVVEMTERIATQVCVIKTSAGRSSIKII
ncbi:MAG: AAA family ATPase [Tannerellaceae bacterium]|nr:AAA family ATPase [Tannerellaceae bacterium]